MGFPSNPWCSKKWIFPPSPPESGWWGRRCARRSKVARAAKEIRRKALLLAEKQTRSRVNIVWLVETTWSTLVTLINLVWLITLPTWSPWSVEFNQLGHNNLITILQLGDNSVPVLYHTCTSWLAKTRNTSPRGSSRGFSLFFHFLDILPSRL